mgnify:FL=1
MVESRRMGDAADARDMIEQAIARASRVERVKKQLR